MFKRVNLSLRLSWTLLTIALKPFGERLLVQRGPKKRTRAPVFVKCWCVSKFVPLITYRLDPSVDLRDGRNSSVAFWSQVLKIKFLLKLFIVYFIWEGKNEEIKIYVFICLLPFFLLLCFTCSWMLLMFFYHPTYLSLKIKPSWFYTVGLTKPLLVFAQLQSCGTLRNRCILFNYPFTILSLFSWNELNLSIALKDFEALVSMFF